MRGLRGMTVKKNIFPSQRSCRIFPTVLKVGSGRKILPIMKGCYVDLRTLLLP